MDGCERCEQFKSILHRALCSGHPPPASARSSGLSQGGETQFVAPLRAAGQVHWGDVTGRARRVQQGCPALMGVASCIGRHFFPPWAVFGGVLTVVCCRGGTGQGRMSLRSLDCSGTDSHTLGPSKLPSSQHPTKNKRKSLIRQLQYFPVSCLSLSFPDKVSRHNPLFNCVSGLFSVAAIMSVSDLSLIPLTPSLAHARVRLTHPSP